MRIFARLGYDYGQYNRYKDYFVRLRNRKGEVSVKIFDSSGQGGVLELPAAEAVRLAKALEYAASGETDDIQFTVGSPERSEITTLRPATTFVAN